MKAIDIVSDGTEISEEAGCSLPHRKQAVPEAIARKIATHPCYSEEAHHFYARIHVPVAPKCNIQCNYCNRKYDCINESRPGVTSSVLTPKEAVARVGLILGAIPEATVVGIAGPGDPLANPERTFTTLRRIREVFPDLKLCLSTNGLMLLDYLDEMVKVGVEHLTVTVSGGSAGGGIYRWVFYQGQTFRGEEGAALLYSRQLEGIKGAVARDILVKVNIVMVPGYNDQEIPGIAKKVKELGAFIVNIMPLIPVEGTAFEKVPAPTSAQLQAVRDQCEEDIRVMRHCRQCRADAVGLLGQDQAPYFPKEKLQSLVGSLPLINPTTRERVLQERSKEVEASRRAREEVLVKEGPPRRRMRVAVASKGHGVVNLHFGHASEFLIYDVGPEGIKFIEARPIQRYCYGPEGGEDEDKMAHIVNLLSDCQAVLSSRIGREPAAVLSKAGIAPVMAYDFIEKALDELARGQLQPVPWA